MSRIRLNGDGTADWLGLTGWDLAAVFRGYAHHPRIEADDRVLDLAFDAVGACMALWESQP